MKNGAKTKKKCFVFNITKKETLIGLGFTELTKEMIRNTFVDADVGYRGNHFRVNV